MWNMVWYAGTKLKYRKCVDTLQHLYSIPTTFPLHSREQDEDSDIKHGSLSFTSPFLVLVYSLYWFLGIQQELHGFLHSWKELNLKIFIEIWVISWGNIEKSDKYTTNIFSKEKQYNSATIYWNLLSVKCVLHIV